MNGRVPSCYLRQARQQPGAPRAVGPGPYAPSTRTPPGATPVPGGLRARLFHPHPHAGRSGPIAIAARAQRQPAIRRSDGHGERLGISSPMEHSARSGRQGAACHGQGTCSLLKASASSSRLRHRPRQPVLQRRGADVVRPISTRSPKAFLAYTRRERTPPCIIASWIGSGNCDLGQLRHDHCSDVLYERGHAAFLAGSCSGWRETLRGWWSPTPVAAARSAEQGSGRLGFTISQSRGAEGDQRAPRPVALLHFRADPAATCHEITGASSA